MLNRRDPDIILFADRDVPHARLGKNRLRRSAVGCWSMQSDRVSPPLSRRTCCARTKLPGPSSHAACTLPRRSTTRLGGTTPAPRDSEQGRASSARTKGRFAPGGPLQRQELRASTWRAKTAGPTSGVTTSQSVSSRTTCLPLGRDRPLKDEAGNSSVRTMPPRTSRGEDRTHSSAGCTWRDSPSRGANVNVRWEHQGEARAIRFGANSNRWDRRT